VTIKIMCDRCGREMECENKYVINEARVDLCGNCKADYDKVVRLVITQKNSMLKSFMEGK